VFSYMSKDFTHSVVILISTTTFVGMLSGLVWVLPSVLSTPPGYDQSLAKPLTALELAGRDIYINQGCHTCHTMMVRPLDHEIKRYGRASEELDDIYEYPNLWGSKRTGPDLTNLGRKYSDKWHEKHLYNPRDVVPASVMPSYPWLFEQTLSGDVVGKTMTVMQTLGVPYSDEDISQARIQVEGKLKSQALIAYLQSLGVDTRQLPEKEEK